MPPAKRRSKGKDKKKGFVINFELSLPGLLGVGVVCFCIFLWMFLLGVWSGETLFPKGGYRSAKEEVKNETVKAKALKVAPSPEKAAKKEADVAPVDQEPETKVLTADRVKKAVVQEESPAQSEPEEAAAFFAVQVGAFKDSKFAVREVEIWRSKGYKPFSRPPEDEDDAFTRVYVGHFDSMESAHEKAAAIGAQENIKPFVVLIADD